MRSFSELDRPEENSAQLAAASSGATLTSYSLKKLEEELLLEG